jgi:hypothetical protein
MECQSVEREEIVRLPYELLPWQEAVKADRHRNRTIHAGRRSGKTHLLCDLEIEAALTYATGLPCWYVAPTYGMAKDIAWGLLKDFTADLLRAGLVTRYYETELKVDFRNGSSIHLKGADNQDSLRGRGLGFLGIDEIALMNRDVWLRVLRPATSDYKAPTVFIGTPKGYNYFFDLCEMEKKDPAQWKTFHIKTSEAGTLDPAEIAQARRDLDDQSFRQEYEASFEMFAGQIFHWETGPMPGNGFKPDEIFYGGDFGYSVNPSVLVKIYRKADRFWVQEKIYQPGLTNQALGKKMIEVGVKTMDPVYFDSAEPKSIQELYEMGLNIIPSGKGPDSVRAGIDFLKAQKITIVDGSENIVKEHRGYCWKADKNGAELPEPMKFNDHAMDAIRYAIVTHMKQAQAYLGVIKHDVRPA